VIVNDKLGRMFEETDSAYFTVQSQLPLVGPMKTSRTSVWLASLLAEIQLVYYMYETEEIAIALCCRVKYNWQTSLNNKNQPNTLCNVHELGCDRVILI
jgi:hypothetical protein